MTRIACLHLVLVLTLLTRSKSIFLLNWIGNCKSVIVLVLIWDSRLYMACAYSSHWYHVIEGTGESM